MEELLTYAVEDEIALIGLDRPKKRNAINDALVETLHAAVKRAGGEAKAAVLFGHGEHFSAGLILPNISSARRSRASIIRANGTRSSTTSSVARSRSWRRCTAPWSAAARACRRRASARRRRHGVLRAAGGAAGSYVGGGGSVRIARLMSATRMADLLLTGRILSAAEAERLNLVHYFTAAGGRWRRRKRWPADGGERRIVEFRHHPGAAAHSGSRP